MPFDPTEYARKKTEANEKAVKYNYVPITATTVTVTVTVNVGIVCVLQA
jgi:hypothetical protein